MTPERDLGASGGILALFDPDPGGFLGKPPFSPWQIHSQTSQDAAFAVKRRAGGMRERVYRAIAQNPAGLTDEEMGLECGMAGDTIRPRRLELFHEGRIAPAGERPTRSGRMATVWIVAGGSAA